MFRAEYFENVWWYLLGFVTCAFVTALLRFANSDLDEPTPQDRTDA